MKLRSALVASLMACTALSAQAVYVVNTGTPVGSTGSSALNPTHGLGASFNLSGSYTINSIEGYMNTGSGGTLHLLLFSGAPTSTPIFQASAAVPAADGWVGLFNLGWSVGPGSYTVAFATPNFSGFMENGAPMPLATEWTFTQGNPEQKALDIGVRIDVPAPVPEPETYALLAAGLSFAALVARRRKPLA